MSTRKALNSIISVLMIFSLLFNGTVGVIQASAKEEQNPGVAGSTAAVPLGLTALDEKVPHYFGPYPNWANSPFTLPNVAVEIANGGGSGATATASVGANGTITDITITNPGSGYTSAPDVIFVSDTGSGASATASFSASGVVTAIDVTASGAGFTAPIALIGAGGPTDATATVYGGVDAVLLDAAGSGYTMPTVDFDLPDAPDGVQARGHVDFDTTNNTILGIIVDNPGSGYSHAPQAIIRDGTIFDPVPNGGTGAQAHATLTVQSVVLDTFGSGYASAPSVSIGDIVDPLHPVTPPIDRGATATASIDLGAVTSITLNSGGSGYVTAGGIKKFQDGLPVLCDPKAGWANCTNNNLGQHIPIAVPDTTTFPGADYYVIGLVQHREQMSSSLPASGTLLREYVQLETTNNSSWSKGVALQNDLVGGTSTAALMPNGSQAVAVDDPHFLGPIIVAQRDRPVRIVFYNLLPNNAEGNLFLPVDSTMMGSGMGPMPMSEPQDMGSVTDMVRNPTCTDIGKGASMDCFKDNRATLHLHGGTTPWISDGTAHQWITPANEETTWPQGVGVSEVPDMANVPGVPDCTAKTDGCMTFYYTNQQSARLLFYHDHAWGITRLNVYAGEAAGYVITDSTENKLFGATGLFPDLGVGTPLVIQDRTFVPQGDAVNRTGQLYEQDPTWDETRWGGYGNLWYHHVYMPAQNPGDPSGMSAYGRWMYGPWFWPPAGTAKYQPIDNPYYDPGCNLDDPSTWQYQTDPFCEPPLIPGTPNISVGMEQFNDTPLVNGTAYPTTTVQPKSYRFRILNAANDRFWNLQWYVADSTGTEVALKASEVAAAQTDPNIVPTPDTTLSPVGPSWIQIGTEGGFLPAPVVIPNQPITWITDPTRFDVGNVDQHSLLLAPAERADVIVDFSKYAGKTLILYNDAPAAFPARVASYDYYTGAPDLSPVGAPSPLPGYGPNTRTIMQVVVENINPDPAFNLTALRNAFKHHADGSGVFEAGQHPIIVGQAGYNSAYGTSFAASSWCNKPNSTITRCDGFARISEQGGDLFGFNTLKAPNAKLSIKLEPKAIHDEMNAASFDEFGRMTANLGLEAVPANPGAQNVILYPFVNPATELIDGTNLPSAGVKVTPISSASDGTQIWKITHNGVDTHPIHFHLYDVQVLNRVTWDNIVIPPDANELGWKDTIRVSPLEDTIIALRPVIPDVPFEVPNSIRTLNPMMPADETNSMFNNIDPQGLGTANIINRLVNFGWEYVYHCHILSHEEMDMMRPVSLVLPPRKPSGLTFDNGTLTWTDNSITETQFVVQRKEGTSLTWENLPDAVAPAPSLATPLEQPNLENRSVSYTDLTYDSNKSYQYRVAAQNTVGYGAEFPSLTAESFSETISVGTFNFPPDAPSTLTAALVAGPKVNLQWIDNATTETGFTIERAPVVNNVVGTFAAIDGVGANITSYTDTTVATPTGATYAYRVFAFNANGNSLPSNNATVVVPAPPVVSSITLASPNPTGAATVKFTVTFSKAVTGVDKVGPVFDDFALSLGGTVINSSVKSVTGTGTTYTVTVDTGSGNGTLGLNVVDKDTILDAVGNSLGGTGLGNGNFTGPTYDLNRTVPTVQSIALVEATPTNASVVHYTVTFSESVTGVDVTGPTYNDFTLALNGITGASITDVSGTGATYTVTVNTGSGSGTLGLNLVDKDTILNSVNNPLGGAGLSNGNFTGDIYTLDKTPPTVSSIAIVNSSPTNVASVDYTVTFSEPVTGVEAADFTPNLSGGITGASVTNVVSVSTTVYTVTVDTGTGSGSLGLDMLVSPNTIFSDAVGNSFAGPSFTGAAYTIDKTAPTVAITLGPVNPTGATSVDYTVTFSEPVTGVDAADFVLTQNGVTGASITSLSGSGAAYTVTVDTGINNGLLGLNISGNPGINIVDLVGNALTGVPLANDATYTIAKIPPTVQSIVRASATNPTNATSVDYTVTFSETVSGVDTTDFALASGSIADASVANVSGSGASYTVTVNSGTADGTLGLNLVDDDSIRNGFNIPLGGTGGVGTAGDGSFTGETYSIDQTPPTVQSIVSASANPTNAASMNYTVTFSEAVTGVDTTDFVLSLTGGTGASITGLSGSGTTYTVAVNTGSGNGTLRLDLMDDNTIIDAVSNPLGGAGAQNFTTGKIYNVDKTAPTVVSILRASADPTGATSVSYTVNFSEAVAGVDTTDFTLTLAGITGASVASISGSGMAYTVTINTGSGSGTLSLNMSASATVTDLAGNALGNLPFSGEIYTIVPRMGTGIYDDRNTAWNYIGSWTRQNTTGPYQGTFTYSTATNDSAVFAFNGNKITLYYTQYTNRGTMNIYIDDFNTPVATINANGPLVWQKTWTSDPLTPGVHTLKLVHASGTYVDVDAITILP